jgi:hypothetical protein
VAVSFRSFLPGIIPQLHEKLDCPSNIRSNSLKKANPVSVHIAEQALTSRWAV